MVSIHSHLGNAEALKRDALKRRFGSTATRRHPALRDADMSAHSKMPTP
jgi:hypothetical protein